jgi:hypothetical protein
VTRWERNTAERREGDTGTNKSRNGRIGTRDKKYENDIP